MDRRFIYEHFIERYSRFAFSFRSADARGTY